MAGNNSVVGGIVQRQINDRVIVVQILVLVFLGINFLLMVIFFKKECFYTTPRYILFAVTLLSDSLLLFISDIMLILNYFQYSIQVWLCIIITISLVLYTAVTPVSLTAMTLERYVAICMPLRHGELCSTRSTVHCVLIIHCISFVPCIVTLSIFFAYASRSFYKEQRICSVEVFMLHVWQEQVRSAVSQFFFLIMCITIIFSYVLHGFQLLLCLIQLWCPFIEAAVFKINFRLFEQFRYFIYIVFYIASRCLSPLIYGFRDDSFFRVLKNSLLSHKRNLIRPQSVHQSHPHC